MPDALDDARLVASRAAAQLIEAGAQAVVLVGSVARGDALPTSDIDLIALGARQPPRLVVVDGWQVSVTWHTSDEVRRSFRRPADAGGAVPAWRGARILADPRGEAAHLRSEAHAWDWTLIDDEADDWVADQVTGFAEEVHRLVGQSGHGGARAAAVMRGLLATRLAVILAVHHRILYDSENRLWDLVAGVEGPQWTDAQDAALGVAEVTPERGERAALELYAATAARTGHLLDADQAAVVNRALDVLRAR